MQHARSLLGVALVTRPCGEGEALRRAPRRLAERPSAALPVIENARSEGGRRKVDKLVLRLREVAHPANAAHRPIRLPFEQPFQRRVVSVNVILTEALRRASLVVTLAQAQYRPRFQRTADRVGGRARERVFVHKYIGEDVEVVSPSTERRPG